MKTRLLAAALAAILAAPALAASPIDLTFASAPSPQYWTASTMGTGPKGEIQLGSFDMTFPATSVDDPATGAFAATLTSSCKLQGDFDVVAGYKLIKWPYSNGVRVGIVLGGSWAFGAVERTSFGPPANDHPWFTAREVYLTHMGDGVVIDTNGTTDTAGTLRLVRIGNELTGYFAAKNGSWQVIHSGYVATEDLSLALQGWSHNYTFTPGAAAAVKASFTRFEVVSGAVVCPN